MENKKNKSELIIYQTEDGKIKIDVRFQNETVWLTQQLMAELFQTTQQNISLHIQNIFEEGELTDSATHKEFLSVQQEGNRSVKRSRDFYNYDKFNLKRIKAWDAKDSDFDRSVKMIERKSAKRLLGKKGRKNG